MEAVIFDMDGVIVDTEPGFYIVANQFLERYGKVLLKNILNNFSAAHQSTCGRQRLKCMDWIFL